MKSNLKLTIKTFTGFTFILLSLLLSTSSVKAEIVYEADSTSLEGRWDITIDMNGKPMPSWLEVRHSGLSTLIGDFVGTSGSARPISKINFNDKKLNFSIPPQWETGNDLFVVGSMQNNRLSGTMVWPNGKSYNWTGVRAPTLRRQGEPAWGQPVKIFNGTDLKGWHAMGANQWVVENGVLKSPKSGSNLVTDNLYNDFKLHIEFRYPKESNSGVYLRGRYEVQVEDNMGMEPLKDYFGGIYGFIAPNEMAALAAGEWQSYDITLVGRNVSVVANGKQIICRQDIPGITGGALDSNEGEPGPLLIQGDHGPIEYRNIVLTPAK